jgi:hypothetical protein
MMQLLFLDNCDVWHSVCLFFDGWRFCIFKWLDSAAVVRSGWTVQEEISSMSAWTLKMELMGCSEMLVATYQSVLHNIKKSCLFYTAAKAWNLAH